MTRLAAVASCLLLAMAGCGDGDGAGTTEGPGVESPTTTLTAEPPPEVVAVETDPCELVTAEEVASATGMSVGEVRPEPPIACVFDLDPDAAVGVFVSVEDGQGRATGPAALFTSYSALVADGEAQSVPDLGQAALYAPGFRALVVDAGGGAFIAVGVNGGFADLAEPLAALEDLATRALDRM